MVVAGESSGDLHLSSLIREMGRRTNSPTRFYGIAGPRAVAAGCEVMVPMEKMAVMGIVEVIRHFPFLYGVLRRMRRELRNTPPDLLLLVDYPGFNLLLAKTAKRLGVPVLFYISPQVWAWRSGRIRKIAQRVDQMAVIFPFEVPYYADAGVSVRYVGHPLVGKVISDLTHEQAREQLGIDPGRKTVGLFPGSRSSEVSQVLGDLLEAAERMQQQNPEIQFILSRAPELSSEHFLQAEALANTLSLTVVTGEAHAAILACDAIVSVSGTVTLEMALLNRPMVVIYRTSPLSYWILEKLIQIPHVSLVNIVAEEPVVPELLQGDVCAERIASHLGRLLEDGEVKKRMLAGLHTVRERLGGGNAASNLADWIEELFDANRQSEA